MVCANDLKGEGSGSCYRTTPWIGDSKLPDDELQVAVDKADEAVSWKGGVGARIARK